MEFRPYSPEYGRAWRRGVWSCNLVFTTKAGFAHKQTWQQVKETKMIVNSVLPHSWMCHSMIGWFWIPKHPTLKAKKYLKYMHTDKIVVMYVSSILTQYSSNNFHQGIHLYIPKAFNRITSRHSFGSNQPRLWNFTPCCNNNKCKTLERLKNM